jgi:hypothetical protein
MASIKVIESKDAQTFERKVNDVIGEKHYLIISSGVNPKTGDYFSVLLDPNGDRLESSYEKISTEKLRKEDAESVRYMLDRGHPPKDIVKHLGLRDEREMEELLRL